ncbi:ATP-binding protein [Streptomyces rhizosphaericus]|uniref:ATP-binding protein n=1 Tax=Streptomyces rhizosphaericus TaxID=114699 RepID=UPI001180818B|nr:ATP-binding protein [Streptomyces rhizosphaericus]
MLARPQTVGLHEIDVAVDALRVLGLSEPSPELRRALRVALTHSSYLYEHRDMFPGVTRSLLDVLQRLGMEYLRKQATVEIFRRGGVQTAGSLSKEVGLIPPVVQSWSTRQEWIGRSCAVGGSLKDGPLPARSAADLCYQVVGVLCLAGEDTAAAALVGRVIAAADDEGGSIGDPKTELQERLQGSRKNGSAVYEYQREGPDHALTFRAVVTDGRGRRGTGTGPSKKRASQQAALDFLRRHVPEAFGTRNAAAPRPVPAQIPRQQSHARVVRHLQDLFSLTAEARPLLSQSLIHSSWAYEHREVLAACHQQDNQVLGFVGSQVLNYEHALAGIRRVLPDPPEELSLLTLPNEVHDSAFRHAGLESGLLLGAGQASLGIPVETGANAFQAVIGAVFVARGFPGSLRPEWPRPWEPVWRMVAPEIPREQDPTTLLQRAASAMKLQVGFAYRMSGPGHAMEHHATAILSSGELGTETQIEGACIAGRPKAKHRASQAVLTVLDQLAGCRPAHDLGSEDRTARAVGRFLLCHQAAVLAAHRVPVRRWVNARLFGLHWASSPADLLSWAQGADELITGTVDFRPSISHFEHAFRAASELAAGPQEAIEPELAAVLDILERLQTPDALTADQLQRLVQLADLCRCLGSDDLGINLRELADDWHLLHRGRLLVPRLLPSVRLSGRERAILDAGASAVLGPDTPASVEVLSSNPLRLRFLADAPLDPAAVTRMCTLWSSVSRTTMLTPNERGIDATILTTADPTSAGPITRAARAALQPAARPYQAAVADLLHDLKNQLVAARLANSSPADTRTARLQQQLAASRHLDQAHALTARLRSTTSLLGPSGTESVDIGSFLRHYASGVLTRLPGSISLSIPDAPRSVRVALDGGGLTAVLDNLVGNAIEALRDGGSITLEWTADDDEAVVEITDDGPGLPPEVIAALEAGERVRSTKPGGNGLGLLGVRSLLNRAGGELTTVPAPSGTGTAWLITLPIAPTTTPEDL